jgi:hypothetical protein
MLLLLLLHILLSLPLLPLLLLLLLLLTPLHPPVAVSGHVMPSDTVNNPLLTLLFGQDCTVDFTLLAPPGAWLHP